MIAADMTVDAVSAASVDVVTSASPRTVSEQRVELGVAATQRASLASLAVGARVSHEHDYDAVRARVDVRRELAQRNTTLQLGYVAGYDVARSVVDASFRATRRSHEVVFVATQLLSARTIVDLTLDGTLADGYHASPYRDVPIEQAGAPLPSRVPEQTPALRRSIAGALRVRHSFSRAWSAMTMYRYYRDDWSVASHALSAELYRTLDDDVLAAIQLRHYAQGAADFYRARYSDTEGMPELRTRDRTLGAMGSTHAAATIDTSFGSDRQWHAIASVGVLHMTFAEFLPQRDRDAVITHLALSTTW